MERKLEFSLKRIPLTSSGVKLVQLLFVNLLVLFLLTKKLVFTLREEPKKSSWVHPPKIKALQLSLLVSTTMNTKLINTLYQMPHAPLTVLLHLPKSSMKTLFLPKVLWLLFMLPPLHNLLSMDLLMVVRIGELVELLQPTLFQAPLVLLRQLD